MPAPTESNPKIPSPPGGERKPELGTGGGTMKYTPSTESGSTLGIPGLSEPMLTVPHSSGGN